MLPRVFDLFTQIDRSLDRSEGGLGIGLTLVSRLVEMHGGTVQAFSAGPGRGSEFVVRLPALSSAPANAGVGLSHPCNGAHKPAPAGGRPRVLVVDDNRDSARSLALLLEQTGCKVQTAYDGEAALEAAEAFDPDAVLLDIGLPRLNGFEAGAAAEGAATAATAAAHRADRLRPRGIPPAGAVGRVRPSLREAGRTGGVAEGAVRLALGACAAALRETAPRRRLPAR